MQLASEAYEGAMVRVMYGPDSKLGYACLQAKEWCLQSGVDNPDCRIAGYLYPHCKLVAGNKQVPTLNPLLSLHVDAHRQSHIDAHRQSQ